MVLMDLLIEDLSITDENQPLHKEVAARSMELWNEKDYGKGMSTNTAEMIATLVRQPEMKKGKGRKQ
jgi:phage pi2 protein 07